MVNTSDTYVLRVYTEDYSFDQYDDNIYTLPESEVSKRDLCLEIPFTSAEDALEAYRVACEEYEGYTYCVKDVIEDRVCIGGILEEDDAENFVSDYY